MKVRSFKNQDISLRFPHFTPENNSLILNGSKNRKNLSGPGPLSIKNSHGVLHTKKLGGTHFPVFVIWVQVRIFLENNRQNTSCRLQLANILRIISLLSQILYISINWAYIYIYIYMKNQALDCTFWPHESSSACWSIEPLALKSPQHEIYGSETQKIAMSYRKQASEKHSWQWQQNRKVNRTHFLLQLFLPNQRKKRKRVPLKDL